MYFKLNANLKTVCVWTILRMRFSTDSLPLYKRRVEWEEQSRNHKMELKGKERKGSLHMKNKEWREKQSQAE